MTKNKLIIAAVVLLGMMAFICFTFPNLTVDRLYSEMRSKYMRTFALPVPEEVSFAGEKVPTQIFYVSESLDRELLVNANWHSNTLLLLKRAHRFFPVIEPILKKYGVPDDMKYLALIESGLMNVVSPSRAAGYWQFLEASGKQFGLEVSETVDERYHIERSTEAACKYLNSAYNRFGSWTLAAASYNAGMQRISTEISNQQISDYYELQLYSETARYIYRAIAMKLIFENPEAYGYYLRKKDLYPEIPVERIPVSSSIPNLINYALDKGISYRTLKELNPWLRSNKLDNKSGNLYFIQIPKGEYRKYDRLIKDIPQADSLLGPVNTIEILNRN